MNEPCLPKSFAFPNTKSLGRLAVVVPWLLATTGVPKSATKPGFEGVGSSEGLAVGAPRFVLFPGNIQ